MYLVNRYYFKIQWSVKQQVLMILHSVETALIFKIGCTHPIEGSVPEDLNSKITILRKGKKKLESHIIVTP